MLREIEFANVFEKDLLDRYPKNTVIREYRIDQFVVDFSIIDSESKEILSIFELKINSSGFSSQQLAGFNGRIQQISRIIGKNIPFYYVVLDENKTKYSILKLTKDDSSFKFEETDFPKYGNLKQQQNLISTQLQKLQKEKDDEIDWLRNVSWLTSVIIILIFVVFKICLKTDLTFVDLALILSSAFLVIFPYIKKISYKDLSIEMHEKSLIKHNNGVQERN